MVADEAAVWDRFIEKFPGRFDSVDYDFRVGEGETKLPFEEENYVRMAKMLSQLRIDALCWNGDQSTIIEVKERAVLSAIGQLQGYKILFVKDLENFLSPQLLMVCSVITEDVKHVFQTVKIPVEVV
jgi:hypothetical protein